MPDNVVPFARKGAEPDPEREAFYQRHPHMPEHMWQCGCEEILYYLSPEGHVCFGCGKLLPEYPNFG
jgi:hypothetical protein